MVIKMDLVKMLKECSPGVLFKSNLGHERYAKQYSTYGKQGFCVHYKGVKTIKLFLFSSYIHTYVCLNINNVYMYMCVYYLHTHTHIERFCSYNDHHYRIFAEMYFLISHFDHFFTLT